VKVKVEVERVERNIEEIREIISNLTQRIVEAETLLKEPLEEKETEFTQLEKKMGEMEKEGEKQKDLWGEVEKKLTEKENFAKELGTFLAEGKEKTKQMLEKLNQYQKLLQEGKKTGDELVGFLTHGMEILQELSALQEEVKQRKTTLLQSWKLFIESAQKAAEMIRIIRESGEKIIFLLQEGESILKEYTLLRNQIRSLSF
jgi:chromosome segregation ATPase